MRRKHRRKNQKKIIITSMVALVFLFSVGYAAFSSEFLISGKGTIVEKEEETAASMLVAKAVTTGDGLYADEYEEGRYVYKGAEPANYITFNGEEAGWRIISVEADGTIKIIRNSSLMDMSWDTENVRDSGNGGVGGTYCANATSGYGCNAWTIHSNFVNNKLSGTVLLDASLNTYLNTTYKNSLTTSSHIQDHDYGIGSAIFDNTDLAAQISDENSIKWNGSIGLISLSDYIRTNTNSTECGNHGLNQIDYSKCKDTTWVNSIASTATNGWMWTMTPSSSGADYVFHINASGNVNARYASYNEFGFAPVLYLKSDIKLLGEGTEEDPYVIEGSESGGGIIDGGSTTPNVVYRWTEDELYIGDSIEEIETTSDPDTLGYNYYLKHEIDSNNLITASYVCFVTDDEYCMKGADTSAYQSNVGVMQANEIWFNSNGSNCSFGNSNSYCDGPVFSRVRANSEGYVVINGSDLSYCRVYSAGNSYCGQ